MFQSCIFKVKRNYKWSTLNEFCGSRQSNWTFSLNKRTLNESVCAWPTYREFYETEAGQQALKKTCEEATDSTRVRTARYNLRILLFGKAFCCLHDYKTRHEETTVVDGLRHDQQHNECLTPNGSRPPIAASNKRTSCPVSRCHPADTSTSWGPREHTHEVGRLEAKTFLFAFDCNHTSGEV